MTYFARRTQLQRYLGKEFAFESIEIGENGDTVQEAREKWGESMKWAIEQEKEAFKKQQEALKKQLENKETKKREDLPKEPKKPEDSPFESKPAKWKFEPIPKKEVESIIKNNK